MSKRLRLALLFTCAGLTVFALILLLSPRETPPVGTWKIDIPRLGGACSVTIDSTGIVTMEARAMAFNVMGPERVEEWILRPDGSEVQRHIPRRSTPYGVFPEPPEPCGLECHLIKACAEEIGSLPEKPGFYVRGLIDKVGGPP